mmetsp:Transcript_105276/g.202211  ORF Transcript_105276/g.202211 Transcript_105276/m.202211 type:complete len:375 (-) Transcript_105276:87-1211(-)
MAVQTPRVVPCKVVPPVDPSVDASSIERAALSAELDQSRHEAACLQAELAEARQALERESQRHDTEVRAYKNERRIMEEAMRRTMTELVELRRRLAMFERSSSNAQAQTVGVHRIRSVPPERVVTPERLATPRMRSATIGIGVKTSPPSQPLPVWVAEGASTGMCPGMGSLVGALDAKLSSDCAGGSAATASTSTAMDGSIRFSEPTASPHASSPCESLTTTLGHMEHGIAEMALKMALQRSAEVLETTRAKALVNEASSRSMTPPATASRTCRRMISRPRDVHREQSLPQQLLPPSGSTTPRESALHAFPRPAGLSPRILTPVSGSRSVPHGGAVWNAPTTQRVSSVVTVQTAVQAPSLLMVLPPPRRSPMNV